MSTIIPKWMRQIIDNPSILAEFIEDLQNREAAATREGVKASKEGNTNLANALFGKAEAFESLRKSVLINKKEGDIQDAFQSQTGSNTASRTRSRSAGR